MTGRQNTIGKIAIPAIGICTLTIYIIAFLRLSNTFLPILTQRTIDEKSSSSNTIAEASLATSVHLCPIAIPICAALSAGASLTPSPVMATK